MRTVFRRIVRSSLIATVFLSLGSVASTQNLARTEVVFPFFIVRSLAGRPPNFTDTYLSSFQVLNPNSAAVQLSFEVFDQTGKLVSSRAETVAALSPGFFSMYDFRGIGWVKATSTLPVVFNEEIVHSEGGGGNVGISRELSRIGKAPPLRTRREILLATHFHGCCSSRTNTGIAIVFPSSTPAEPATGMFTLRRNYNGEIFAQKTIKIPANGQFVGFYTDLFPETLWGFSGMLEMSFDRDVFVTAIQMSMFESVERMEEPIIGSVP